MLSLNTGAAALLYGKMQYGLDTCTPGWTNGWSIGVWVGPGYVAVRGPGNLGLVD